MTRQDGDPEPNADSRFPARIRRRAALRTFWLSHGERSIARNLAMIGALGWLVITPTLAGLFFGRWIDHRFHAGVFWTGALLTVGVALGCALAWRRVEQIQREDSP